MTFDSKSNVDLEKFLAEGERLEKLVFIKDGAITIAVKSEYQIELDRCKTHQDILAWVAHLSEKTWMTTEVLRRFVALACRHHKLELRLPPPS